MWGRGGRGEGGTTASRNWKLDEWQRIQKDSVPPRGWSGGSKIDHTSHLSGSVNTHNTHSREVTLVILGTKPCPAMPRTKNLGPQRAGQVEAKTDTEQLHMAHKAHLHLSGSVHIHNTHILERSH